ncbi:sensor histidine kinase [Desulfonema magnum]|uniref:histidine kinase n=1 Tax=Desulfonema magnum TaxID=45655 RepID=A0A975BML2_9BACT|nr:PAS domain S-box protein [Desulfonema magnum]QTA88251.1 Two component system histidine kinase, PAS and GAF domains-containing [Desulfonema magnum]
MKKEQIAAKVKDHPLEKEEDLKIEKDRYRVFIEDVADGFYETDLRGNFKFFNNAFCRIYGYSRNEFRDHNFREFMDEKNARTAFESFNNIYRTGKGTTDIIWEIIRKDGVIRMVEISANLIIDNNGEKIGFRGIARDITEKFLFQKALKESEQLALCQYQASRNAETRYRALLDFLPDPVIVFNMDSTVSYLNPAFMKVFGWTLEELEGRYVPFVPDFLKEQTRQGIRHVLAEKVVHGVETKRLTKDGRILDILLDIAIIYEEDNKLAGQVGIFRDITAEKRISRINQALFRITKALHRFRGLDERLEFIIKDVQELIAVEGASIILADEEKKEFFFRAATYENTKTEENIKEIRFPIDKGVAGYVYRTGQPLLVSDTSQCPHYFHQVDERSGYKTRNLLDVPIRTQDRTIGVLCTVDKKEGEFDQTDVELLNMIAGTVALPIENARINQKLKQSYEEVRSLNRAKERVIHHLSHELKTPVSILDASLRLLRKKASGLNDNRLNRILSRAQRSVDRILEMQYEIEDILKEKDYEAYHMLSTLLNACTDELETLFELETGNSISQSIVESVRDRVEEIFGQRNSVSQEIRLDEFVEKNIETLGPRFAHRKCNLQFEIRNSKFEIPCVRIPSDVLAKITEGLIRNALENTPDGGRIEVTVRKGERGPEFEVRDFGVGITKENQRLIFESNFTTRETMQYSSRNAYDFNAGGKGFDLLRMKIFSERYSFKIQMNSERCGFIPRDEDICPGKIELCDHCQTAEDCFCSGGTTVIVQFPP